MRRALLACGIVSSLHYVAINFYVPTQRLEYDVASQTVSELSAIGAPTRTLWVWMVLPYSLLLIAFGTGVRFCGAGDRLLGGAGTALVAHGVVGIYWPPMHLRGTVPGMPLTDILHIVWAVVTLILMLAAITLGALASRRISLPRGSAFGSGSTSPPSCFGSSFSRWPSCGEGRWSRGWRCHHDEAATPGSRTWAGAACHRTASRIRRAVRKAPSIPLFTPPPLSL